MTSIIKRFFMPQIPVLNLNNYKPSIAEKGLLGKGLSIIPTHLRQHETKILQDFLISERKIWLYQFLHKTQKMVLTQIQTMKTHIKYLDEPMDGCQILEILTPKWKHKNSLSSKNEFDQAKIIYRYNLNFQERKAIISFKTTKTQLLNQ